MSSLAKFLWVTAVAAICCLGLFAGHQRDTKSEPDSFVSMRPKVSFQLIEAEIRALYPEFTRIQRIEAGLARTMNTPSIQLYVTDVSGNRYSCAVVRTAAGWEIHGVRRIKIASEARLI